MLKSEFSSSCDYFPILSPTYFFGIEYLKKILNLDAKILVESNFSQHKFYKIILKLSLLSSLR